MSKRTLGIDVGLNGAIALVVDGELISVVDMPTVTLDRNGKAKRQVSVPELVQIVKDFDPTDAYTERVFAKTGQGVTSVFSFGRSLGVVEGVLGALKIKNSLVTPQTWQKRMAVTGGKDGSRARAMDLFPEQAQMFKRVKDDGRADAALIAAFGVANG
jgi:crossover junction endodeoxyribonuclease RuvC